MCKYVNMLQGFVNIRVHDQLGNVTMYVTLYVLSMHVVNMYVTCINVNP